MISIFLCRCLPTAKNSSPSDRLGQQSNADQANTERGSDTSIDEAISQQITSRVGRDMCQKRKLKCDQQQRTNKYEHQDEVTSRKDLSNMDQSSLKIMGSYMQVPGLLKKNHLFTQQQIDRRGEESRRPSSCISTRIVPETHDQCWQRQGRRVDRQHNQMVADTVLLWQKSMVPLSIVIIRQQQHNTERY